MNKTVSTANRLPYAVAALVFVAGGAFAATAPIEGTEGQLGRALSEEKLTTPELLPAAREKTAQMESTLQRSAGLQEIAKAQKDVIKLNCVNDKVVSIKGHILVANQSVAGISEALGRNDDASARHEFHRVRILHGKTAVLGTEASNCVGEDISYVGATTVNLEIDPNIPSGDVTDTGHPVLDTSRPVAFSPPL